MEGILETADILVVKNPPYDAEEKDVRHVHPPHTYVWVTNLDNDEEKREQDSSNAGCHGEAYDGNHKT